MGNWTKYYHGDDKNGQGRIAELTTSPQIIHAFSIAFYPRKERTSQEIRFFYLKREDSETAADVLKRILEVEKNCAFEAITAAELLASKFLSYRHIN